MSAIPFSPNWIKQCLADYGTTPQKKWGQNFLLSPQTHARLLEFAQVGPQDDILEIGPGLGHLTQFLLPQARRVWAVEIDPDLVRFLTQQFGQCPNFEVVHADILADKHTIQPQILQKIAPALAARSLKIVANLPYNVATPVIMNFIKLPGPPLMVVTIQKEVGQRLAAKPGAEAYGVVSVYARLYCIISMECTIAPGAFYPPPQVESCVIKLAPRQERVDIGDPQWFDRVVQTAFQLRRKTIANTIRHVLGVSGNSDLIEKICQDCHISPQQRGETLDLEAFIALAKRLKEKYEV